MNQQLLVLDSKLEAILQYSIFQKETIINSKDKEILMDLNNF